MNEVSLYIHIPFCARKCMYCDFPSFCGKESLMLDYARALSCEIEKRCGNNIIKTIFIGGGTPTYLSLDGWEIISHSISKLKMAQNAEFTVECNPGTITEDILSMFRRTGVNRLSIGLQAWQDNLLESLGRIHRREEFLSGYNLARRAGFNNINVDVMFGLPNQTMAEWKETLESVIALEPEHISCYSLIIEEGTPFFALHEKNKLKLPDEELEREMYNMTQELLGRNGYSQYEISNFALPGRECRHNIVYWSLDEYIGCGSAAHSYLGGKRYRNEEKIEKYIEVINNRGCANVETICNSLEDNMEEFMFMGLRMVEGISEDEFFQRFDRKIDSIYGDVICKHERNGLLRRRDGRIFLTNKGIELSNMVMSDFLL